MFSVRIVTTDHYQSSPLPALDVRYADQRGSEVKKVPVIRIFGSTPAGQKTCVHVHGVFPYLYVPYDGTAPVDRYLRQFASSLDKAISVAQGQSQANIQHVYKVVLVSGIAMYGYHDKEQQFLKIYMYNPSMVRKAADLLLGGAVLNKAFQPHESHIPYMLQFFIDYNLYGMNMINVGAVKFRRRQSQDMVESALMSSQASSEGYGSDPMSPTSFTALLNRSGATTPSRKLWQAENIPSELYLDGDVPRDSTCELEVDVVAPDILNRLEVGMSMGANPGLAALWEDERQRRRDKGANTDITPPASQERSNVESSESEDILRERLLQILHDLQPYMDSQSDSDMSQDDEDMVATQASEIDLHESQDLADSQGTVMLEEEEEEAAAIVNVESIHRIVSASQSFCDLKPAALSSQDKSLVNILEALENDASPQSSQQACVEAAVLEDHDSILSQCSQPRDTSVENQQEQEALEMSQQVWDTDQQDREQDVKVDEYDLSGMDDTWVDSQLEPADTGQQSDSDADSDIIPQYDGAIDEEPRGGMNQAITKRLGMRGPSFAMASGAQANYPGYAPPYSVPGNVQQHYSPPYNNYPGHPAQQQQQQQQPHPGLGQGMQYSPPTSAISPGWNQSQNPAWRMHHPAQAVPQGPTAGMQQSPPIVNQYGQQLNQNYAVPPYSEHENHAHYRGGQPYPGPSPGPNPGPNMGMARYPNSGVQRPAGFQNRLARPYGSRMVHHPPNQLSNPMEYSSPRPGGFGQQNVAAQAMGNMAGTQSFSSQPNPLQNTVGHKERFPSSFNCSASFKDPRNSALPRQGTQMDKMSMNSDMLNCDSMMSASMSERPTGMNTSSHLLKQVNSNVGPARRNSALYETLSMKSSMRTPPDMAAGSSMASAKASPTPGHSQTAGYVVKRPGSREFNPVPMSDPSDNTTSDLGMFSSIASHNMQSSTLPSHHNMQSSTLPSHHNMQSSTLPSHHNMQSSTLPSHQPTEDLFSQSKTQSSHFPSESHSVPTLYHIPKPNLTPAQLQSATSQFAHMDAQNCNTQDDLISQFTKPDDGCPLPDLSSQKTMFNANRTGPQEEKPAQDKKIQMAKSSDQFMGPVSRYYAQKRLLYEQISPPVTPGSDGDLSKVGKQSLASPAGQQMSPLQKLLLESSSPALSESEQHSVSRGSPSVAASSPSSGHMKSQKLSPIASGNESRNTPHSSGHIKTSTENLTNKQLYNLLSNNKPRTDESSFNRNSSQEDIFSDSLLPSSNKGSVSNMSALSGDNNQLDTTGDSLSLFSDSFDAQLSQTRQASTDNSLTSTQDRDNLNKSDDVASLSCLENFVGSVKKDTDYGVNFDKSNSLERRLSGATEGSFLSQLSSSDLDDLDDFNQHLSLQQQHLSSQQQIQQQYDSYNYSNWPEFPSPAVKKPRSPRSPSGGGGPRKRGRPPLKKSASVPGVSGVPVGVPEKRKRGRPRKGTSPQRFSSPLSIQTAGGQHFQQFGSSEPSTPLSTYQSDQQQFAPSGQQHDIQTATQTAKQYGYGQQPGQNQQQHQQQQQQGVGNVPAGQGSEQYGLNTINCLQNTQAPGQNNQQNFQTGQNNQQNFQTGPNNQQSFQTGQNNQQNFQTGQNNQQSFQGSQDSVLGSQQSSQSFDTNSQNRQQQMQRDFCFNLDNHSQMEGNQQYGLGNQMVVQGSDDGLGMCGQQGQRTPNMGESHSFDTVTRLGLTGRRQSGDNQQFGMAGLHGQNTQMLMEDHGSLGSTLDLLQDGDPQMSKLQALPSDPLQSFNSPMPNMAFNNCDNQETSNAFQSNHQSSDGYFQKDQQRQHPIHQPVQYQQNQTFLSSQSSDNNSQLGHISQSMQMNEAFNAKMDSNAHSSMSTIDMSQLLQVTDNSTSNKAFSTLDSQSSASGGNSATEQGFRLNTLQSMTHRSTLVQNKGRSVLSSNPSVAKLMQYRHHPLPKPSPSAAYKFKFEVPTPLCKQLKGKSNLQGINSFSSEQETVRMHPKDARKYSLLKVGRETVKLRRLSAGKIARIKEDLKAGVEVMPIPPAVRSVEVAVIPVQHSIMLDLLLCDSPEPVIDSAVDDSCPKPSDSCSKPSDSCSKPSVQYAGTVKTPLSAAHNAPFPAIKNTPFRATENAPFLATGNASIIEMKDAPLNQTENALLNATENTSVSETKHAPLNETENTPLNETENVPLNETQCREEKDFNQVSSDISNNNVMKNIGDVDDKLNVIKKPQKHTDVKEKKAKGMFRSKKISSIPHLKKYRAGFSYFGKGSVGRGGGTKVRQSHPVLGSDYEDDGDVILKDVSLNEASNGVLTPIKSRTPIAGRSPAHCGGNLSEMESQEKDYLDSKLKSLEYELDLNNSNNQQMFQEEDFFERKVKSPSTEEDTEDENMEDVQDKLSCDKKNEADDCDRVKPVDALKDTITEKTHERKDGMEECIRNKNIMKDNEENCNSLGKNEAKLETMIDRLEGDYSCDSETYKLNPVAVGASPEAVLLHALLEADGSDTMCVNDNSDKTRKHAVVKENVRDSDKTLVKRHTSPTVLDKLPGDDQKDSIDIKLTGVAEESSIANGLEMPQHDKIVKDEIHIENGKCDSWSNNCTTKQESALIDLKGNSYSVVKEESISEDSGASPNGCQNKEMLQRSDETHEKNSCNVTCSHDGEELEKENIKDATCNYQNNDKFSGKLKRQFENENTLQGIDNCLEENIHLDGIIPSILTKRLCNSRSRSSSCESRSGSRRSSLANSVENAQRCSQVLPRKQIDLKNDEPKSYPKRKKKDSNSSGSTSESRKSSRSSSSDNSTKKHMKKRGERPNKRKYYCADSDSDGEPGVDYVVVGKFRGCREMKVVVNKLDTVDSKVMNVKEAIGGLEQNKTKLRTRKMCSEQNDKRTFDRCVNKTVAPAAFLTEFEKFLMSQTHSDCQEDDFDQSLDMVEDGCCTEVLNTDIQKENTDLTEETTELKGFATDCADSGTGDCVESKMEEETANGPLAKENGSEIDKVNGHLATENGSDFDKVNGHLATENDSKLDKVNAHRTTESSNELDKENAPLTTEKGSEFNKENAPLVTENSSELNYENSCETSENIVDDVKTEQKSDTDDRISEDAEKQMDCLGESKSHCLCCNVDCVCNVTNQTSTNPNFAGSKDFSSSSEDESDEKQNNNNENLVTNIRNKTAQKKKKKSFDRIGGGAFCGKTRRKRPKRPKARNSKLMFSLSVLHDATLEKLTVPQCLNEVDLPSSESSPVKYVSSSESSPVKHVYSSDSLSPCIVPMSQPVPDFEMYSDKTADHDSVFVDSMYKLAYYSPPLSENGNSSPPQPMSPEELRKLDEVEDSAGERMPLYKEHKISLMDITKSYIKSGQPMLGEQFYETPASSVETVKSKENSPKSIRYDNNDLDALNIQFGNVTREEVKEPAVKTAVAKVATLTLKDIKSYCAEENAITNKQPAPHEWTSPPDLGPPFFQKTVPAEDVVEDSSAPPELTLSRVSQASDASVPEKLSSAPPELTLSRVSQSSDASVSEKLSSAPPELTLRRVSESSDASIPELTLSRVSESSDASVPELALSRVSESSDASVPELTLSRGSESIDASVPEKLCLLEDQTKHEVEPISDQADSSKPPFLTPCRSPRISLSPRNSFSPQVMAGTELKQSNKASFSWPAVSEVKVRPGRSPGSCSVGSAGSINVIHSEQFSDISDESDCEKSFEDIPNKLPSHPEKIMDTPRSSKSEFKFPLSDKERKLKEIKDFEDRMKISDENKNNIFDILSPTLALSRSSEQPQKEAAENVFGYEQKADGTYISPEKSALDLSLKDKYSNKDHRVLDYRTDSNKSYYKQGEQRSHWDYALNKKLSRNHQNHRFSFPGDFELSGDLNVDNFHQQNCVQPSTYDRRPPLCDSRFDTRLGSDDRRPPLCDSRFDPRVGSDDRRPPLCDSRFDPRVGSDDRRLPLCDSRFDPRVGSDDRRHPLCDSRFDSRIGSDVMFRDQRHVDMSRPRDAGHSFHQNRPYLASFSMPHGSFSQFSDNMNPAVPPRPFARSLSESSKLDYCIDRNSKMISSFAHEINNRKDIPRSNGRNSYEMFHHNVPYNTFGGGSGSRRGNARKSSAQRGSSGSSRSSQYSDGRYSGMDSGRNDNSGADRRDNRRWDRGDDETRDFVMGGKLGYHVITPLTPPPTWDTVELTSSQYGLPSVPASHAFYGNHRDGLERPREGGGQVLKVTSTRVKDLGDFDTAASLTGLENWRAKFCMNDSLLSTQSETETISDKLVKEPAYKYVITGDQRVTISPCQLPPDRQSVEQWLKGRQLYKQLKVEASKGKEEKCTKDETKGGSSETRGSKHEKTKGKHKGKGRTEVVDGVMKRHEIDREQPSTSGTAITDREQPSTSGTARCTSKLEETECESSTLVEKGLDSKSHDDSDTGQDFTSILKSPAGRGTETGDQSLLSPAGPSSGEGNWSLLSPAGPSSGEGDQISHSTPMLRRGSTDLFSPDCTPISGEKRQQPEDSDLEQSFVSAKRKKIIRRLSTGTDTALRQAILTTQMKQQFCTPAQKRAAVSQIDGPTPKNSFGFRVSQQNFQDAKALHEYQHLTILSVEIHMETRGDLRPDPEHDPIQAIFYSLFNDVPGEQGTRQQTGIFMVDLTANQAQRKQPAGRQTPKGKGKKLRSPEPGTSKDMENPSQKAGESLLQKSGIHGYTVVCEKNEQDLIQSFTDFILRWDPDILVGYEIQMLSWGYLLQRASCLNINLAPAISRVPASKQSSHHSAAKDEYGADHDSEIHIAGRIVLNLWRLLRHEVTLNVYTFENVAFHVLHRRIPLFSHRNLTAWYKHRTHLHRWKVVQHYMARTKGNLEIMEQLDLVGRTSEFARVFGIEFYDVLSRGSQYRVESMMLRVAKPMNYIPVSPSVHQRARMKAPECIALTLEPKSRFYTDPVLVLDFQSLYPSIMIAYNYCYSTCLGRLEWLQNAHDGAIDFGCTSLNIPPAVIKKLQNDVTISPNGVVFCKSSVKRGVLPVMVEEILKTRLMVKKAMAGYKDDKTLTRLLHARQMGLKLIANVTYGYTGANFSGRMPCIEVGDSIVRKARETLERSIRLVEETPRWGAEVLYGDTDSMFLRLKGRSKDEAFVIGQEIADAVTAMFPKPIKLRFEKVYLPCLLQTKKRYVGFMYESRDQKEPVFDAKGIETVRRDTCTAVSKMLERSIKILFSSRDVSQVKSYIQQQCQKVMEGNVSLQDFVFAKEYRGMSGYRPGACVPALEISKKLVRTDRRAEPRVGERVPYVIVYGSPGLPLIQLVRQPLEVLKDTSLRLNATYYISKQILPPLHRFLSLLGVDVFTWYQEMPHSTGKIVSAQIFPQAKKGTISQYFSTSNCPVCDRQTKLPVCKECMQDPQTVCASLNNRITKWDRAHKQIQQICGSCVGCSDVPTIQSCVSLDCPVLYRMSRAIIESGAADGYREILTKLFK